MIAISDRQLELYLRNQTTRKKGVVANTTRSLDYSSFDLLSILALFRDPWPVVIGVPLVA